jgi:transmembrane sensor
MKDDKDLQAAEWLSRLRTRSVGNAELAEFARWRRLPGNAEAYRRAERLWEDAAGLRGDAQIEEALESAMRAPRRRFVPWAALGTSLAAVLLLLFATSMPDAAQEGQRYRTAVGERSLAKLADGSRMDVDADSEVRVRLAADRRVVELVRGQALFAVRHDASRPFEVNAPGGVTVRAIGTRFDVEALTNGDVAVALIEGRVAVSRAGRPLAELAAGETLMIRVTGGVERREGAAGDAADWTGGHLAFRDVTLRDAVAQVNRYSSPSIAIVEAPAAAEKVSGEFSTDDPDGFVRGVNALLGPGTVKREDRN